MAYNQFTRNLENVNDATDWNKTQVPKLAGLDALLRCFICKEFFTAPVITGCNHTFCSLCIREYLVATSHCPLCDSEQYESSLKKNSHLEEVVHCFVDLRSQLLEQIPKVALQTVSSSSCQVIEIPSDDESSAVESKTPNSSSSIDISKQDQEMINSTAGNGNPTSTNQNNINQRTNNRNDNSNNMTSVNSVHNTINEATIPTREELVRCPICNKSMSASKLQTTHLDNCLSRSAISTPLLPPTKKRKGNISSFFLSSSALGSSPVSTFLERKKASSSPAYVPPVPQESYYERELLLKNNNNNNNNNNNGNANSIEGIKKLPKLDFSSLSTAKVKEKLSNINIPTTGTRTQLELRYNHFYVLHNSNLDSNHPISDKLLRQRLNRWELSHLSFAGNGGEVSLFQTASALSSKNITDKDFPIKEWNRRNKSEYKRLTKLAKETIQKLASKKQEDEKEEEKVHIST